ncbi:MAG: hypothetical protein EBT55_05070 [Proteobacteria bacterium]|nr:hypothetical protein [Pseudomonadota bacterium]
MFTSKFPSSWGWATWKDRWLQLERNFGAPSKLSLFKTGFKNGGFSGIYHWMAIMTRLETGDLDSWAYRWLLTHFKECGKSFSSDKKLITELEEIIKCKYEKNKADFFEILFQDKYKKFLENAILRCKQQDQHNQQNQTPNNNPSSKIYEIIEYIKTFL